MKMARKAAEFLTEYHLCNKEMWKRFADVYREQTDGQNMGWRGEYFGKMMRGAVLVYEYTRDESLYNAITDAVCDILTVAEDDGRVSSYKRDIEFDGWDIWGRKYIILSLEYYLDVCKDEELKGRVITFISRCADYVSENLEKSGRTVFEASRHWLGVNSASVLEPIVRLYRITGEKRYLDFAAKIVNSGGADGLDLFALAYENRLYPYQYGVSKAYEMTSLFEGLIEYYEVTGIEKYKTAIVNYAYALLDSEISIIGCSGISHELFDHTRTRQTTRPEVEDVLQETCVTVTLMKFFSRVLEMTDDSVFADVIEKAFYNAYLGALNTEHCRSDYPDRATPTWNTIPTELPFDSYSPLIAGRRGRMIGGYQMLSDRTYYGCCACIGAAGVGVYMKSAVILDNDTLTVNFYEEGIYSFDYKGKAISLEIKTDYPKDGRIFINIKAEEPTEFTLRLRVPEWADAPSGYRSYKRVFSDDTLEINFDMPIKIHYPECLDEDTVYTDMSAKIGRYYSASAKKVYSGKEDENYFAVTRGPLTLACDSRTGKSADSPFFVPENGTLCESDICEGAPCLVKMKFEEEGKEPFYLVDYQSAGRDWQTLIAAWLLRDDK